MIESLKLTRFNPATSESFRLGDCYRRRREEEDFQLICFDIVSEPSTPDAYVYPGEGSPKPKMSTFNMRLREQKENSIDDLFKKILGD